jgi:hypothetical protein
MSANLARLLGAVCAGIAIISTVAYYVFRLKELSVLREIRDRLPTSESK